MRLRGGAAWEGKEGCLPVLWRVVRRACRERWGGEERGERTRRKVEGGEGACLVAWRGVEREEEKELDWKEGIRKGKGTCVVAGSGESVRKDGRRRKREKNGNESKSKRTERTGETIDGKGEREREK